MFDKDPDVAATIGQRATWFVRRAARIDVQQSEAVTDTPTLQEIILNSKKPHGKDYITMLLSPGRMGVGDVAYTKQQLETRLASLLAAADEDGSDSEQFMPYSQNHANAAILLPPGPASLSKKAAASASRTNASLAQSLVSAMFENDSALNPYYHAFHAEYIRRLVDYLCQDPLGKAALAQCTPGQFARGAVSPPADFFPDSEDEVFKSLFAPGAPACPGLRASLPPNADGRPQTLRATVSTKPQSALDRMAACLERQHPPRADSCKMLLFDRDDLGTFAIGTVSHESIYDHLARFHSRDQASCEQLLELPESEDEELVFEVRLSDEVFRTITAEQCRVVTLQELIDDVNVTTPLTIRIRFRQKPVQTRPSLWFGST